MKSIDVSDAAQQQRVFELISNVFNNLAMRVVLDSDPEKDTQVSAFVDTLKTNPSLHFKDINVAASCSTAPSKDAVTHCPSK